MVTLKGNIKREPKTNTKGKLKMYINKSKL